MLNVNSAESEGRSSVEPSAYYSSEIISNQEEHKHVCMYVCMYVSLHMYV